MKYRIYQFFQSALIQVILVLIISYASALALPNSAIENYRSTIVRSDDGKVQRYSVLVATVGDPKTNSDFSEYFVQRVDPKYYAKGQIYVKTRTKTDNGKDNFLQGASKLNSALQAIGSTEITAFADAKRVEKNPGLIKYGLDRLYKISIPLDKDPFEVCAELMRNPDVEYACPVTVAYSFNETPNDPSFGLQYTLTTMKVLEAWKYSKGSPDIKIAIVDSGVDYEHPDLAAHIWTNPNEIPDDGIDNDENGKIDDYRGWDFAGNKDIQSLINGEYEEDNDPMNRVNTHGTMVSGCVGAVPNNGIGIVGTAYNCKLIPIKIGSELPMVGTLFQPVEAVAYAAELGADIINCSWGAALYSPADQDMVNYIVFEKNAVIVAGSGNSDNNNDNLGFYPATYKNVLSVGAVDDENELTDFTNYGYSVDTYAPGAKIYTTQANGGYEITDGTSFSGPNVSGVAALVKAIHPDWSAIKIFHQIKSTSDIMETDALKSGYYGITNALKAVTYNSPNSDKTVPGISAEKIYVNKDTSLNEIRDYQENEITIELKNYLASTKNLKVKAISADGILNFASSETVIAQLDENASATITLKAKLTEDNPWSDGYANIALEYSSEDGEYKAFDLVKVRLQLPADATSENIDYKDVAVVLEAEAIDSDHVWATGVGPNYNSYACYMDLENKQMNPYMLTGFFVPKCIAAISKDVAYFAMLSVMTNSTVVLKTEDGGKNFTMQNVDEISTEISAIYFKDKDNGLVIGTAVDGEWRIGTTDNGGLNWSPIAEFPKASSLSSEIIYKGHARVNDCVYFATSEGDVFKSEDFGKTWNKKESIGSEVPLLAFIDENTGLAIYDEDIKVALTTDGANSWKDAAGSLPEKEALPFDLYADRVNRIFILTYNDGSIYKTEDLGTTWKPIRKPKTISRVLASTANTSADGKVAIFHFAEEAERVLFNPKKSSVKESAPKYVVTPNPASNHCQILLGKDADKVETLQIFSSDGRLIMTLSPSISNNAVQINTSSLPSGQYNILLVGKKIRENVQLIIVQ